MIKWRIYKEAVEEVNLKKLLKQNGVTKLPSGMQEKYGKLEWHKYGGYAGEKTIRNMCIQLERAGWKRGGWKSGGKPDGSVVGNSEDYVSPDGKVAMSYYERFGVTSHDNSYYITFKLVEQVNESDEEIDYCVQYAKDAIDRILNQPGIDDFILSRRGKITVPLKALLPYEGGTPDVELVEAICKRCSDDKIQVVCYGSGWTLIFPDIANQINESDEEDSFTRSDRPQIYRYYDDDETPIEEFVKHVHSAEHEIEDIFIQNSDVYENANDPWGLFCDDMHGENETLEESLDLDYYMNQAAYDQLPEDIRKYTHLSTGTCDFDAVQWLRGIFERLMPICKDQVDESSRFGFNVGDKVELKVGKEPNRFGGWGKIEAGSQGEIVAIDKPMPGAIKVKLEDGTVVTMGERQLKLAGTDNEPWKTLAANRPPEPKRDVRPEKPEDYYMRPTSYGSPRYTGD